jgi:hypothetical protein
MGLSDQPRFFLKPYPGFHNETDIGSTFSLTGNSGRGYLEPGVLIAVLRHFLNLGARLGWLPGV